MDSHIERVLWSEDQISARVSKLADQISGDIAALSPPPSAVTVVGVATGAFLFLADLVRRIRLPVSVDFLQAESYSSATEPNARPTISADLKLDVHGNHVILVEDIVDTGSTLARLIEHVESGGASSVSVCAFLDKPSRRKVSFDMVGRGKFYTGFQGNFFFG